MSAPAGVTEEQITAAMQSLLADFWAPPIDCRPFVVADSVRRALMAAYAATPKPDRQAAIGALETRLQQFIAAGPGQIGWGARPDEIVDLVLTVAAGQRLETDSS